MTKQILKYASEYIAEKDVPFEKRAELKLAFIDGCEKILSLKKKVTDADIHNYAERTYFHHTDSVIWAFKDGAKWMRDELQSNPSITIDEVTDKELLDKAIDDCIIGNKMYLTSTVKGYVLGYKRCLHDNGYKLSEAPTKPYLKVFLDWFLKWRETKVVIPYFEVILEEFKKSDEYKEFAKSINEK